MHKRPQYYQYLSQLRIAQKYEEEKPSMEYLMAASAAHSMCFFNNSFRSHLTGALHIDKFNTGMTPTTAPLPAAS